MRAVILETLQEIERDQDVRILYACESGSRAWGFASPDSDFDVRFLYVRPRDRYLTIREERDVIELPVTAELDFSGWDLKKALGLFRKSNATLYEWLQSPIVYRQDESFTGELRALMPRYFSPRVGGHHYHGTARRTFEGDLQGEQVRLKKYFYALRPVLAGRWIVEKGGVPPMEFTPLRALIDDLAVERALDDLLEAKRNADEKASFPPVPALQAFLAETLDGLRAVIDDLPAHLGDPEELSALFRRALA